MSVSREAILSRQRVVKNFAFGTCIFTHVSLWATWRARPLRDGQKGNKKHLSCNIAAKRVGKRCCAFYHPYQTFLQQIRLLTVLTDVGRETDNIVFYMLLLVLQQCKTSCTFLCALLAFSPAYRVFAPLHSPFPIPISVLSLR